MRIVVAYNNPDCSPINAAAELGVLGEVELVASSLAQDGHATSTFAVRDVAGLCAHVERERPDLVFNCCESFAGRAGLEMNVAALFELLGVAYTGSPPLALGAALNKHMTKVLLRGRWIRTPAHTLFEPGRPLALPPELHFPLIVKPVAEDASIGIDAGAVVHDAAALRARARFVWRELGQAALVEEFIDGREFNVSALATAPGEFCVLPIGEIAFDGLPEGCPRILDYESKWNPAAGFRQADAARCPASLDPATAARCGRIALAALEALAVRDYARVELRLRDSDQSVFVIEVNPNPDLSAECEFLRAARASGRTNREVIAEIAARARERGAATDLSGGHCDHERLRTAPAPPGPIRHVEGRA